MKALSTPQLAQIRSAAQALAPYTMRTPLLRFDQSGQSNEIYLKLESLQAIGAFKIRPVGNILLNAGPESLGSGVYTASSGNAGLALAWMARKLDIAATVYAPDSAPRSKLAPVRGLGARVEMLPDDDWWHIIESAGHPDDPGLYVDAVRTTAAMAGSGTIGLEIAEQCPDVDSVIVPFGGGGLSCGIAAAIRAVKPETRIIVAESDAATPLTSALRAGRPVPIETRPSFISGAGAPSVLREMWPLINRLVDGSVVVPEASVADAVRTLFLKNKLVVEGAGAIALAGALSRDFRKTVCIVSGGNIDAETMIAILRRSKSDSDEIHKEDQRDN